MKIAIEVSARIVALSGEITTLETALRSNGLTVPPRPGLGFDAGKLDAKGEINGSMPTLDELFAAESLLESHTAKLRTSLRMEKPTTKSNVQPKASAKTTGLRIEIARLESLLPTYKGATLKCCQQSLAAKRTELAHEEGK